MAGIMKAHEKLRRHSEAQEGGGMVSRGVMLIVSLAHLEYPFYSQYQLSFQSFIPTFWVRGHNAVFPSHSSISLIHFPWGGHFETTVMSHFFVPCIKTWICEIHKESAAQPALMSASSFCLQTPSFPPGAQKTCPPPCLL